MPDRMDKVSQDDKHSDKVGQERWAGAGPPAVTRAVLRPGGFRDLSGFFWVDFRHDRVPHLGTGSQVVFQLTPRIGRDKVRCFGVEGSGIVTADHVTLMLKLDRDLRAIASQRAEPLGLKGDRIPWRGRKRLYRPPGQAQRQHIL